MNKRTNRSVNSAKGLLKRLGLSSQETEIYLYLFANGRSSVGEIARALGLIRTAVYRSCKSLLDKSLIAQISKHPQVFEVLGGTLGIRMMVERERSDKLGVVNTLDGLLIHNNGSNVETTVELINGRMKIYKRSLSLINAARSEVFIVSIGEDIPQELMLANKRACERGVDMRFIAHKYDSTNESALDALKKNGVKVKHYPDWGFHLVLIDKRIMLLGVNNPNNTKDRVSMLLYNSALTKAMREYFIQTWHKAVFV